MKRRILLLVFFGSALMNGVQAQNTIADLKTNCNKGKFCQSKPADCDPQTSCVYFLSNSPNSADKTVTWELLGDVGGSNERYVALGLSSDQAMGNDSLTYCTTGANGVPSAGLAVNPKGKSPAIAIIDPLVSSNVQLTAGGLSGTKLWCRVVQKINPTINSSGVWNLNGNYYFLMASGKFDSKTSGFGVHSFGDDPKFPYISNSMVNPTLGTTSTSVVSTSSKNCVTKEVKQRLVKAHGILMIFGWWFFIASGILAARYLRTLWQDRKLFHSPIWFNLHRGLNAVGVLAVAAAFICIFVRSCGEWEDDTDPTYKHSVLGMTASVCAFFQPIFALVRCHPGTSKRPIFNWAHRIIGIGGLCCASAAIWYATFFHYGLHSQDGYGWAPRVLIIIFYCTLVAVFLLFEFLITICERLSTKFNKVAINGVAQTSIPANQFKIEMAEPKNNSWDNSRVALLSLYMLITAAIGIALACFIGIGRQTS